MTNCPGAAAVSANRYGTSAGRPGGSARVPVNVCQWLESVPIAAAAGGVSRRPRGAGVSGGGRKDVDLEGAVRRRGHQAPLGTALPAAFRVRARGAPAVRAG